MGDTYLYNNIYAVNFWDQDEIVGVEIKNSQLMQLQMAIFSRLWEQAKPIEEYNDKDWIIFCKKFLVFTTWLYVHLIYDWVMENEVAENEFVSWVTVSSKGQVALPIGVRKKMNIKPGDRYLVIIRKDQDGINLIKSDALNSLFEKYSQ